MLRSLRAKLVASYSLIILLCLLLAGSAFVYFLRDYQRQIRLGQLSEVALPISWQVRMLERVGASRDQIASFLRDRAAEQQVRILLIDPTGLIMEDTEGALQGDRLQAPSAWPVRERSGRPSPVFFAHVDRQGFAFISATARIDSPSTERFTVRVPAYSVVLAVPEQSLAASWLELAPSLSFAALVSMVVSVLVALFLSRSISRPIAEITRASEEMARGRYDQNIPVRSQDEVGRLAEAFNHMARQVSVSNRTLRDFLANVSHELRTPLTSIQGFSQAMFDGTARSGEDQVAASKIIAEESGRMMRLVEDLLLLSKIESGQLPMERARLDLTELLRTCIKRSASTAQQQGVAISLMSGPPVPVSGDESRLEQVFRNLLDNALKHTPSGGSVTVRVEGAGEPGGAGGSRLEVRGPATRATVSIHNSGSFIPPHDRERIFERFYQVDKSRARNGEGSGLGLAIAREIAHAHGAEIHLASDSASGTTFTVAFGEEPESQERHNGA